MLLILVSQRVDVLVVQAFGTESMQTSLQDQLKRQRGNGPTYLECAVAIYVLGKFFIDFMALSWGSGAFTSWLHPLSISTRHLTRPGFQLRFEFDASHVSLIFPPHVRSFNLTTIPKFPYPIGFVFCTHQTLAKLAEISNLIDRRRIQWVKLTRTKFKLNSIIDTGPWI